MSKEIAAHLDDLGRMDAALEAVAVLLEQDGPASLTAESIGAAARPYEVSVAALYQTEEIVLCRGRAVCRLETRGPRPDLVVEGALNRINVYLRRDAETGAHLRAALEVADKLSELDAAVRRARKEARELAPFELPSSVFDAFPALWA